MIKGKEQEIDIMKHKVKPIQQTPALSGNDAKRIIEDVKRKPTKAAIERNKRISKMVSEAMNA